MIVKLGIVFLVPALLVVYGLRLLLFTIPPIPEYEEIWWGADSAKVDDEIRLFKINISNEDLLDLEIRLNQTLPFQKPLEDARQHYGMNTNLLQTVIDFWKTQYNWREREEYFNQYPQYIVNIQGLNIHYVHVKPKVSKSVKVLPLMMLHGWVGSFREFYDIIPFLTTPQKHRDFVFELIIPSLPGFGFSDASSKPGLSAFHIAVVFKNLMTKLNYEHFYVHGTDWGSSISQQMSILFPQRILALHSSFCIVDTPLFYVKQLLYSIYPPLFVEKEYEELMFPLLKTWSFRLLETGYFHQQSTKPDTIGVGLRESPAGLAAYLLEKFITLTNPSWNDLESGGLTKKFTLTQLLDNIMVYWTSRSITTSMRLYSEQYLKINYEKYSLNSYLFSKVPISIPTGCARFKYDILFYSENMLKEKYLNLIHLTFHEAGHFPALEVPKVLAEDIFSFIEKVKSNHILQ